MSRIGRQPVKIPSGVKVDVNGRHLKISSAQHSLELDVHPDIKVEYERDAAQIRISRSDDERFHRALHGTVRAHIANMVLGVTQGFDKSLQIFGAGYGVKVQGANLLLTVGFARPAVLPIPDGITVDVKTPNARGNDIPAELTVHGPDKCTVGQFAAELRQTRPPEPYKGKGVRYVDERIRRKVGKAFGSTA